jgi:SAM-dependent methyltransferase
MAMASDYLSALLKTAKYERRNQIVLKERVFVTFDNLLAHCRLSRMQPGQIMLDLGTADGALIEVARAKGLEARGLDVTDGIDFETDTLPVADNSVDVVTAVSLIEHLYSPRMMLSEALRVLKPRGALILVTPNWRYSYREFFDDPTHVHPYTVRSLGFTLKSSGFQRGLVVPWIVCKPAWMWTMPMAFEVARAIPFRWSPSTRLPAPLTGKSKSILALGVKPAPRS